jgi:hypothetical protein
MLTVRQYHPMVVSQLLLLVVLEGEQMEVLVAVLQDPKILEMVMLPY